jgi:pyruvate dehydrogenase E1 component beta subunit
MESEQMYGMKGEVPDDDDFTIPIGKAKIKREGGDVTVVAHGKMYHVATKAAQQLEKEGVEVEIVDPRTVKPLDMETIVKSIKKTNRCVIVDEAHPFGGLAAEVGYLIQREAFDYLDAPVQRVTLPDTSAPFAKNLFDEWFPSPDQVIEAINTVTYRK